MRKSRATDTVSIMPEHPTPQVSVRVRELDHLLATIRRAGSVQLSYEMWDGHGRQHASAEQCSAMETELATATRERESATRALEALVIATRAEAPAELTAWADAHEAYLAAFVDDCAACGESDGTATFVARRESEHWAEVRAGKRAFVDENVFYVTMNAERYRRFFGIDP
jgi:hypothetical protein